MRLRGQPTDSITLLGGVFQDNPPGGPFNNDSQLLGSTRYGAIITSIYGLARLHHNYSLYAVVDQTVWQPGGDDPRAAEVVVRPMFGPNDQNLINFSINGGATVKAPLPGRSNNTFGVGFGVADVSPQASALARDTAFFTGDYVPKRGAETFVEVTYQIQLTPMATGPTRLPVFLDVWGSSSSNGVGD